MGFPDAGSSFLAPLRASPRQFVSKMLPIGFKEFEVLYAIVLLVAVLVVNHFRPKEWSAEMV